MTTRAADPTNVRAVLAAAILRLAAAGCQTPRLDAELLLAEATGWGRAGIVIRGAETLPPDAAARFAALVARRELREPVALILGRRGFRHLELHVDGRVLVPRPETETLVEAALELPRGARVLDVGTGSGAIALALKHERPDLDVTAADLSTDALDVARENAQRLGIDVRLACGDLLAAAGGPWDAVLSNPPYVAEADRATLPPELAWEPPGALFGGPDGLATIRRLIASAAPAPWIGLEIGAGQAPAVTALLHEAGWTETETHPDLAGIARVVVGRRP